MDFKLLFCLAFANREDVVVADTETVAESLDTEAIPSSTQLLVHPHHCLDVMEVRGEVFGVEFTHLRHLCQVNDYVELFLAVQGLSLRSALVQMRVDLKELFDILLLQPRKIDERPF